MKSVFALVVAVALATGSMAFAALPAAAAITIGVTPSLVEMKADPGATGSQELTVSNQGDEAFDATTGVADMRGLDRRDLGGVLADGRSAQLSH